MYEIRNTCISINIVDNLKNLQANVMALKPVKYWSYWQVEILTQLFKRKKKVYLIELIAVGAISQLTRWCLQSWWQSGCHPGSDSRTGNLRGAKETESKTIIWYIILQSYKTSFLPLYYTQRKKSHPKSSSHPQRMLCELDVGEMNWLIHNQIKKEKKKL